MAESSAATAAPPPPVIVPVPAAVGPPSKLRSAIITVLVILLAVAVVLGIGGNWNSIVGSSGRQTTDDAYLRSDVTPLSTKAAGIVAVVASGDYQEVKAGQLLASLRDDDFQAQVALAAATVIAAQAALENLAKQRDLQNSRIAGARANLVATAADLERARHDRVREEELLKEDVSTQQRVEHVVADHDRLSATLVSRQADIDTQRKQIAVLDSQEAQLKADLLAKEASLKVAQVNLDYTKIIAPTDGILGERKVRPGQLVSAGTQVVSLVGKPVWVVANYKETQLANVTVGDAAEVRVDGIPDTVFSGKVDTISPATGAQFSLLPPDNASGNFTKIAQRIPVKIVLDAGQHSAERLRSGMSVVATIKTAP